MRKKLLINALVKYISGLVMTGLLLFLPAGTIRWTGAWLFIGLLFLPMLILGIVLFIKTPDLLARRLQAKEEEGTQKKVIGVSALLFLAGFVLAGVDHRLDCTRVPLWLTITASGILLLSYGLYAEVMRENAYLSRTVEVQEGQKVIDTGMYSIVRHPMYAATVLLFLSIPLVLGSWIGFAVFLMYPVLLGIRIRNEEKVLRERLPGYAAYCGRVRWRMIPCIW
ncbi:MAG: isoprenylcysteine carboxylmethyltransferase family protein [Clostridia bacterium]|nr:isoprenylcysteine carboxylmethyltransferase family protein [Clostridia bacterium]